jgi:mRNA interferase RelE/StbE
VNDSAYRVTLKRSAQKEIRALDEVVRTRVLNSIRSLASDARPSGCRKLVGVADRWRIRIGDYRVIYSVDDNNRVIEIIAARHRSKAYD